MSRIPCGRRGPKARQEPGLGHDVAALALDGLDDDRGDLVGRHQPLEQHLVEPGEVGEPPERGVVHAWQQRPESAVVLGPGRGEAQGPVRPPVEAAEERDQVVAAGRQAGELDCRLHDLRTRVAEVHASRPAEGGESGEPLARRGIDGEIEVGRAVVQQLGGLVADRRHHPGMGMAGGVDRDARGEVEEAVPVEVLDDAAAPRTGANG